MSTSVLCVRAHVQDREYMHVWVTVRTVSCFVSSLFGVWTNHLLLAVIPAHRYAAFPAPTADFTLLGWEIFSFRWPRLLSFCGRVVAFVPSHLLIASVFRVHSLWSSSI